MLEFLKWWIAGKEMRALNRYRVACAECRRWNAGIPFSSLTADWIREVGEDERAMDIDRFRQRLIGR